MNLREELGLTDADMALGRESRYQRDPAFRAGIDVAGFYITLIRSELPAEVALDLTRAYTAAYAHLDAHVRQAVQRELMNVQERLARQLKVEPTTPPGAR